MSVSLSPCSVPGHKPNFTLGEDEMELGLGRQVLALSYIASSPGHSQILSRSHGEKSGFHSCEIKSGSGLGTRLALSQYQISGELD